MSELDFDSVDWKAWGQKQSRIHNAFLASQAYTKSAAALKCVPNTKMIDGASLLAAYETKDTAMISGDRDKVERALELLDLDSDDPSRRHRQREQQAAAAYNQSHPLKLNAELQGPINDNGRW